MNQLIVGAGRVYYSHVKSWRTWIELSPGGRQRLAWWMSTEIYGETFPSIITDNAEGVSDVLPHISQRTRRHIPEYSICRLVAVKTWTQIWFTWRVF
jgi:hypothetical protein